MENTVEIRLAGTKTAIAEAIVGIQKTMVVTQVSRLYRNHDTASETYRCYVVARVP
jgi:hypothetical protein